MSYARFLNAADIAVVVVAAVGIILGAKKGFVKTVFSFLSIIISLVLAITLYPMVSDILTQSKVGSYVEKNVITMIAGENEQSGKSEEAAESVLKLPAGISQQLEKGFEDTKLQTAENIAKSVSGIAINLISILIVFIIVRILMAILMTVLNLFSKLPVIKSFNKLLGGALGGLCGLLVIYILLMLITFNTTLDSKNVFITAIEQSTIASEMYNHNILMSFMEFI